MAKSGTKTNKGYTNQYGLAMSSKQYANLGRAIKNYNSRIRNLYKRYGQLTVFPKTVKLSEVREQFVNRSSVTQYIRDLNQFKGSGLEIIGVPGTGEAVTRAEYNIIKNRIRRENARRKKISKAIETVETESGYFRTADQKRYSQIDIKKYRDLDTIRTATERFATDSLSKQALRWKETYLNKIDYILAEAMIIHGPLDEVVDKIMAIRRLVEGLSTTDEITLAAHGSPSMDITITSDDVAFMENVDRIYEEWDNFIASI